MDIYMHEFSLKYLETELKNTLKYTTIRLALFRRGRDRDLREYMVISVAAESFFGWLVGCFTKPNNLHDKSPKRQRLS